MFTFSATSLNSLAIHILNQETGLLTGEELIDVSDAPLKEMLTSYLLSPFKDELLYKFSHETALKYNEVYSYCLDIFENPKKLHEASIAIAKHLEAVSKHPLIKDGELFVAYCEQVEFDKQVTDCIVIVKAETRHSFLQVNNEKKRISIKSVDGIDTRKVDKAVLIFNQRQREGFRVKLIDNVKGENAHFWKDDFLGIVELENSYSFTNNYLSIAKSFIVNELQDEYSKVDQAGLLNKTLKYFNENEQFKSGDFEKKVFEDPALVKSFRNFGSRMLEERDIDISDQFEISGPAVKRSQKSFKSVIKLDKNFHIYIHGDRSLIEQGVDKQSGKKYYKIYFDKED